jgi:serine/threonine-protein kinase HipA
VNQPAHPGRKASVCLDGHHVGLLEELDGGRTRFSYDPAYLARRGAIPISLTLPLRAEPYDWVGVHPFFLNLLPEGWLLELATRTLKISKADPFGLLLATCADCIGAVEIRPVS